ncbi:ATP-binding cassette domain-containing protein, partial [Arcobacter caeni]
MGEQLDNNSPIAEQKPNLLDAKNISHEFDYKLFENITFSIQPKESISIIGMSGSGKSTLLNILSSLLIP